MSINFQDPANAEALRLMQELYGKPKASDGKNNLFDDLGTIDRRDMKAIGNAAGQPVTVELDPIGTIKVLEDGTQWKLAPNGWFQMPI